MKNNRKTLLLVVAVLFIFLLSGCAKNAALYDKLQAQESTARWSSQYPVGQFTAQASDSSIGLHEKDGYYSGQLRINEKELHFLMAFDSNKIALYESIEDPYYNIYEYEPKDALLRGRGEIDAKGRFILHIEEDHAHLFEGRLEKIIFLKEDAAQEEGSR